MGLTRSDDTRAAPSGVAQQRQAAAQASAPTAAEGMTSPLVQRVNDSPRSAAQRQRIEAAFGPAPRQRPAQPVIQAAVLQRKVGFEFQMLDSEILLRDKGQDTRKLTWNGLNTWHVEKDGENAEFVVKPLTTAGEAQTRVQQVVDLANKVRSKGIYADGTQAHNKVRVMDVKKVDTQGQPQINTDVRLATFLGGTTGYAAGNMVASARYFGANYPRFNWSPGRTQGSMDKVEVIKATMRGYSDANVQAALQTGVGATVNLAATEAGKLTKAVELSRAYCVLQASTRETAPLERGLTKDMPVLPKMNLLDMEKTIQTLLREGQAAVPRVGAGPHPPITLDIPAAFDPIITALEEASGSGRQNRDVFDANDPDAPNSRHVYGVKNPQKVSDRRNHTLLLEYRRVPVLPVNQWVAFAQQAANDFGTLD
ncbi:hypothetical protein ACVNIS_11510 [Sphaerotilaceae bacterium SBD11-9]